MELNEEDISKWMRIVSDINTVGKSDGCRRTYECLPNLIMILDRVYNVLVRDKEVPAATLLRSFPSLAKFLTALCSNSFFLSNEELYTKLMQCFLVFSEECPDHRAVSTWAMHQIKSMTSGRPQMSVQSAVDNIVGCTFFESHRELGNNLLKTLQAEIDSLQSRRWVNVMGSSLPLCSVPGTTLREISELCLPVIHSSEISSLIESVLSCRAVSDVLEEKKRGENEMIYVQQPALSGLFLEAVSLTQQNGYKDKEGSLHLSYEALVNLWLLYLPSFESEVMNLIEACLMDPCFPNRDDLALRKMIYSRQLPKACASHVLLHRVVDGIFSHILTKSAGSEAVLRFVNCFAKCLKEARHRMKETMN